MSADVVCVLLCGGGCDVVQVVVLCGLLTYTFWLIYCTSCPLHTLKKALRRTQRAIFGGEGVWDSPYLQPLLARLLLLGRKAPEIVEALSNQPQTHFGVLQPETLKKPFFAAPDPPLLISPLGVGRLLRERLQGRGRLLWEPYLCLEVEGGQHLLFKK